jgi:hypothetical protein
MVKSSEPFKDKHFAAILDLQLSGYDREFVEFFRRNGNRPYTAYQLVDEGFAEKGRFASINRVCRDNGLWFGIRQVNSSSWRNGLFWDRVYHAFFLLQPVQKTSEASSNPTTLKRRPRRQYLRLILGGKAR